MNTSWLYDLAFNSGLEKQALGVPPSLSTKPNSKVAPPEAISFGAAADKLTRPNYARPSGTEPNFVDKGLAAGAKYVKQNAPSSWLHSPGPMFKDQFKSPFHKVLDVLDDRGDPATIVPNPHEVRSYMQNLRNMYPWLKNTY